MNTPSLSITFIFLTYNVNGMYLYSNPPIIENYPNHSGLLGLGNT